MTRKQASGKKKYRRNRRHMNKKLIIAFVMLALLAGGCSLKKTVINSTALFMDDLVVSFFQEKDLEFAEAAIPGNLKLLDGLIKGAEGSNEGLLIKGCKLYGMYAMGFLEDTGVDKRDERRRMQRAANFYEKARDYGLEVLKKRPDFRNTLDKSLAEFVPSLQAFGKDDLEALFWTSFAWGVYINLNRHNIRAVADLPKVKAMMERVIAIDDTYFYGMPRLFMIVYYSMPPMFGGNPVKAKAEYDRVKEISGDKFILTDFFMAKYYAVQVQDREMFEYLLDKVENAEDDVIPERLFTAVAKKKASFISKKAGEFF